MPINKHVSLLTLLTLLSSVSEAETYKNRTEGWCDDCEMHGVPSMLYTYDPSDDDVFSLHRLPSLLPFENEINSWGEVKDADPD